MKIEKKREQIMQYNRHVKNKRIDFPNLRYTK